MYLTSHNATASLHPNLYWKGSPPFYVAVFLIFYPNFLYIRIENIRRRQFEWTSLSIFLRWQQPAHLALLIPKWFPPLKAQTLLGCPDRNKCRMQAKNSMVASTSESTRCILALRFRYQLYEETARGTGTPYRPPVVSCHMIYTVRSLPKYTGDFDLATPLDVDRNNKQLKVHRKVQGHWEQDKTWALTCCRHSLLTCNGPAYPPWRLLYTFLQFAILGYLKHTISCDVSWSFTNTLA